MTNSETPSSEGPSVRLRYKIVAYIGGWIAALFATNPDGGLWALVWMFPLGLAAFINRHWANDGGWGVFAACVGVYLVHGYFYFRSRKARSTVLLFAFLVILFLCNISGCREMIHAH